MAVSGCSIGCNRIMRRLLTVSTVVVLGQVVLPTGGQAIEVIQGEFLGRRAPFAEPGGETEAPAEPSGEPERDTVYLSDYDRAIKEGRLPPVEPEAVRVEDLSMQPNMTPVGSFEAQ